MRPKQLWFCFRGEKKRKKKKKSKKVVCLINTYRNVNLNTFSCNSITWCSLQHFILSKSALAWDITAHFLPKRLARKGKLRQITLHYNNVSFNWYKTLQELLGMMTNFFVCCLFYMLWRIVCFFLAVHILVHIQFCLKRGMCTSRPAELVCCVRKDPLDGWRDGLESKWGCSAGKAFWSARQDRQEQQHSTELEITWRARPWGKKTSSTRAEGAGRHWFQFLWFPAVTSWILISLKSYTLL